MSFNGRFSQFKSDWCVFRMLLWRKLQHFFVAIIKFLQIFVLHSAHWLFSNYPSVTKYGWKALNKISGSQLSRFAAQ